MYLLCTVVCDQSNPLLSLRSFPVPPLLLLFFFYLHFSFTLSHPLPLHQNTALCGPSLPVPTILLLPPPTPPTPSSLLQVVKWILLSRSHQGKRRKRKRMEPKVNSKEVGDANLYHRPRAPSLFSTFYSWKSTFCGVFFFFFFFFLYGSVSVAVIFELSSTLFASQHNYPQFCLRVVLNMYARTDHPVPFSSLCLCCVIAHIFNLLRACIHHMSSTVCVCVCVCGWLCVCSGGVFSFSGVDGNHLALTQILP